MQSNKVSISPQIDLANLGQLSADGFSTLISCRPDGEDPDQPTFGQLSEQAAKVGIAVVHIPVVPGQHTQADAELFSRAVKSTQGGVLAFCRTGKRAEILLGMMKDSAEDSAV